MLTKAVIIKDADTNFPALLAPDPSISSRKSSSTGINEESSVGAPVGAPVGLLVVIESMRIPRSVNTVGCDVNTLEVDGEAVGVLITSNWVVETVGLAVKSVMGAGVSNS